MGIFDSIDDALSGKPAQPTSGNPDTKTTKITADDVAAVRARRATPEFQAALKAQDARNSGVSGIDTALSKHADLVHPVPDLRK